jgi:membrane protein insertase Oxa1/YidC/SpoIIIJ
MSFQNIEKQLELFSEHIDDYENIEEVKSAMKSIINYIQSVILPFWKNTNQTTVSLGEMNEILMDSLKEKIEENKKLKQSLKKLYYDHEVKNEIT